jgi:excisionase family DNA binding protein
MPTADRKEDIETRKYLSVAEAAAYLGVGQRTVRRLLAFGELPARRVRKRVLVARGDLDRLVAPARGKSRTRQGVSACRR